MTILDEIAAYARVRVEEARKEVPFEEIRRMAESMMRGGFVFEQVIREPAMPRKKSKKNRPEPRYILECKKASPSKGIIAEDYPYLDIARSYAMAGADAISVLTEPKWFMGSASHLKEIASEVMTPCLRKDFIIDPYMIFEAKTLGAGAVLLISALLDDDVLSEYIRICDSMGMSALVETRDEEEIEKALNAGARVIGVNNRDLRDFSVDTSNALKYRALIPENVTYIAESGISTREDVISAKKAGVDAILIGEAAMRAEDKRYFLDELNGFHEETESERPWMI